MDNHIFRSALSGFNRQDVMEYIERTQKEAAEAAAALEQELEEVRASLAAERDALDLCRQEKEEQEARLAEANALCEQTRSANEALEQAKAALQQDLTNRAEVVRTFTEENQQLKSRLQTLEAEAATVRREKEQVAQLELEARDRAAAIIAKAEAEAAAMLAAAAAEGQETVDAARNHALGIRTEAAALAREALERTEAQAQAFQTAADHISAELRKMDVSMSQLPLNFDYLRSGLAAVLAKAEEE